MAKKTKQPRRRPAVELLEERTLLSTTPSYVPLDQLLTQSLARPGSIPPLSALNLYSPNMKDILAPIGQAPPPGAVSVGVSGETGEQVFAVANKYIAEIKISGLTGAAAADPKQLFGRAVGELAVAKLENPTDKGLASISIDKYLGAGQYVITAGTNFNLDTLTPELQKLPGFQSAVEDYLFPSSALQPAQTKTNPKPTGPAANTATPLTLAPVPVLSEAGAAGGLVFSGSTNQTVSGVGVSISFTVYLDAGQTVAAVVTPGSSLRASLNIVGPDGKSIGSASGSAAGALTALQAVAVKKSGTYMVTIAGVNGTTGNFTLQVLVNAQLQNERFLGGDIDSTLATAQQIDGSTITPGGITRSAMYGNIPLQAGPGDSFVSERGVGVQLVSSAGVVEATINNPALSAGTINGMHIGPNGNLYIGVDTSPGNGTGGEIVELTQAGALVTVINLPNDPNQGGFFFYPFGFSIAADGTLWVAQPNTANVAHLSASGALLHTYATGGIPEWTAVRSDGMVFVSDTSDGNILELNPNTSAVTTFANDPAGLPFGLSFTPGGDLLVADPLAGVLRFNSSGALTQVITDFNQPVDAEVDPSGNILTSTGFGTLDKFTSGGTLISSATLNGPALGLGVIGTEGPAPKPPQTVDYYSFSLSKGQTATAVLSDLGTIAGDIALVSSDGTVLALAKTVNGSEESINSFVAPAAGTYYLRVSGNGVQYTVVLEKNADFGNGSNTSLASAQNLIKGSNGNWSALGALSNTSLFGVDWQNAANQLIHGINPQTGAFTSTIVGPTTPLTNPFGFNMAFDGTHLWFNDGALFGSNTIFELDPSSGAVIKSFAAPTPSLFGLAYLNGSLYGTDASNIFQIDPNTGNLIGQFSPGLDGAVTGIAGDPTRGAGGTLWAVSQFHTIFQIDVASQTVVNAVPDGLSLNEQDIGYNNNELYVSETNGPGANDIAVFSASTLTESRDLPVNVGTFISGLGADGFSFTPSNYYHIKASKNDNLQVSATSPYSAAQGPFLPANSLSAVLKLYDANGNLLATSTPGGSLSFKAKTAGDYFVSVSGNNGSSGDYTLTVTGATGASPAFAVTGTNPPANSYNKPLTAITVDFNDSILLSSLPTAKVTFGGKAATGYQVDNDHEVTWFVQGLPPGLNVPYTFSIAAGAVKDIHGVGLTAFSETIFVNTVPPHLTANSINEGSIGNAGNLTYTVSFNEPIVPGSVSAASFDLHGNFTNADYGASSFSFNSTDTTLTINYSGLPQDNYTLTLFSGGFLDRAGYTLDGEPGAPPSLVPSGNGVEGGNFVVDFTLRHGAEALPVTFAPVAPAGDQIYRGSFTDVVASPAGATNTYTISLAPNQTITLDLTSDANLQGTVKLYDASNHLIASGTAASQGGEVLLETAPVTAGGTYTIVVGGANNTLGLFSLQATLNAATTSGTHGSIGTAQDISGSFTSQGGTTSLGAVLGAISQLVANSGDAYASERGGPGVVVVANAGGVLGGINNPIFSTGTVNAMRVGADGNLYVALDTAAGNGTGGEILKFSPSGALLSVIHLPNDPNQGGFFFYPFGFSVAADGTFWVAQPNTGNVVHVSATGTLIRSYSTGSGSNPEWTAVRADGQVFISNETGGIIQQLDPGSGNLTTFATDPDGLPFGLSFTAAGNLLVSDPNVGVLVYNSGGSLTQTVFDFGAITASLDATGNYLIANADFNSVDKIDPTGNNFLVSTTTPGTPLGLGVAGVDGPAPPAAVVDNFYSFHLNAGESATIALKQLGGTGTASETLLDGSGNVLATGQTGPGNFTQAISNFVASASGTYYIDVHGNNTTYSVTVAKNAAFDTEPNDSQATAQPLPGGGGAVGAVFSPPGVTLGKTFEGLSFNDTDCGCIPPDTNDAVGPTQVVEVTNTAIRISDKQGNNLFTGQIGATFGISAFSDPYIVYDDIAQRFVGVILVSNSSGGDGVAFIVSKDSTATDGFLAPQIIDFGSNLLDFPKLGFNADAWVITGNLFSSNGTPLQYIAIDKSQLLNNNTFVDYLYQRDSSHFRAEVPAQMHGAAAGMPMYLVEEAGFGNGTAARVVTLTNELSNNPTFVDTDIPVDAYGFPPPADQPGGAGSVATNDTTFSHAEWRMINGQGMLVSAQNVSVPDDGFTTSRVRWYEFNTSGTPSLVQQGTINPGPGVSTYYGAPALDINGDIGITYMESSANEFVSMYVAGRLATDPLGTMSVGTDVAPGVATNFEFFRTGDYGGISVDPTDGLTFWAAHEYGGSNPVYNTFVASFTVQQHHDEDWYSFATNAGDNLSVTLSVPGSSTGAQFVNNLAPVIQLFDAAGNLVASGTTSLTWTSLSSGTYAVRVSSSGNTQGEYAVLVSGATGTNPPATIISHPIVQLGVIDSTSGQPGGAQHASAVLGNGTAQESLALSSYQSGVSHGPVAASNNATAGTFNTNGTAGISGQVSYGTTAADAVFAVFGQRAEQVSTEDLLTSLARQLLPVSDGASVVESNSLDKGGKLGA